MHQAAVSRVGMQKEDWQIFHPARWQHNLQCIIAEPHWASAMQSTAHAQSWQAKRRHHITLVARWQLYVKVEDRQGRVLSAFFTRG